MVLDRFERSTRRASANIAHLAVDRARRRAEGSGIRIQMAGEDGRAFRIEAPRGTSDFAGRVVRLEGGVVVRSAAVEGPGTLEFGSTLKARALVWRGSDQSVQSEGPVELLGPELRGGGGRAAFDLERRTVRVEGPVRFEIQPSPR